MYLWQAYDFETKKDGIRDKFLLLVLSYGVAFCALISRSKDWVLRFLLVCVVGRMAEAHSAVAFSFHVTTDGVNVQFNHEALWAVWHSGFRSWKKKIGRGKVSGPLGSDNCSLRVL